MKIVSWNLFYRRGAVAADVSALIEQEKPDLFLMQEATEGITRLPDIAGGHFHRMPWQGKSYDLAVWTPHDDLEIYAVDLPSSNLPASFPQRVAQIIEFDGMSIANVHLSHGQLLNRKQLRQIAQSVKGPMAIIGDFNALGPIVLRGFKDVGPRSTTHFAQRLVPLRLDRCLVRGAICVENRVLKRGPSDHRPIVLELRELPMHNEVLVEARR